MSAPKGWTVLGSGPMADAVRAEIARDPDRYAPETWGMEPIGHCPCCDQDVYRCTTRHTGWTEGFATHANVIHPRCDAITCLPDPSGTAPGCCCMAPNWGPKHGKPLKKKAKPKPKKRTSTKVGRR